MDFKQFEVWFITGSQHLYGTDTLRQVADHARKIARALVRDKTIPLKVVFKPILASTDQITRTLSEANHDDRCVGLIAWMHTFSPAKMWINGLKRLHKPLLHLHTQYNREIPWSTIDMNFMNLNQSAHGGREFGFINSRLGINRKVVVGHWQDKNVRSQIAIWSRVAVAWHDLQTLKIARFGDNMRGVAVTEGDKVEAQLKFGLSVHGYGLGDLLEHVQTVTPREINHLISDYRQQYHIAAELRRNGQFYSSLKEAARIELGLRSFLDMGGFDAFTDTFENLTGLVQLPGIAVQRLMAEGYGFGAEGDWKTAALVRAMKVMAWGLPGGNSFMEDYTYDFSRESGQVLGAHMLEICPSISSAKPSCEIHPLTIGGKDDPVRLVFTADPGVALNASLIDLGSRFRLLVNKVEAVVPEHDLPNLPVARVLWQPRPNLSVAAAAWILAGGAHHTCFSQNLSIEYLEDFADMADIELVVVDKGTDVRSFKQQLSWNEAYYRMR